VTATATTTAITGTPQKGELATAVAAKLDLVEVVMEAMFRLSAQSARRGLELLPMKGSEAESEYAFGIAHAYYAAAKILERALE
jgi:hypothetical protein